VHDFDLVIARSLPHLLELLVQNAEARIVAGATDFIPFVRAGRWLPQLAVDISRLEELRYLREADGWLEIGALTTHCELVSSPLLRQRAPVLAEAAGCIADPQVRARATLGGNLCTASPAADTAPALLVLDAEVTLLSQGGERRLPLDAFLRGPGETALAPGEVLAGVRFPIPPAGAGMAFLKLGRRKAMAISVANAAALLAHENERIGQARLALGAVAPTAVRCPAAERFVVGRQPDETLFAAAADRVLETIRPISDVRASAAYRRLVAVTLARRALIQAWGGTQGR